MAVIVNINKPSGITAKNAWGIELLTPDELINTGLSYSTTRIQELVKKLSVDDMINQNSDTPYRTNWESLFAGYINLKEIDTPALAPYTSQVTEMQKLFYEDASLTELDFSGWDCTNVDCVNGMGFHMWLDGCTSLTKIWFPAGVVMIPIGAQTTATAPFTTSLRNTPVDVYTNLSQMAAGSLGYIDTTYFTMHYSATYQDYLNA